MFYDDHDAGDPTRIIPKANAESYVLRCNHLMWWSKESDIEGNRMHGGGEQQRETIRPEFNPAIMIDFQGAKINSDTGFLLLGEIYERFGIMGPFESELEDARSWLHSKPTQLLMARQRVYQISSGYVRTPMTQMFYA